MLIYLEGNIGGGKSTFIEFLQKHISKNNWSADVLLEPVEEWENTKDSNDVNILQHYYQDQKKYGFAFQINALISRVRKIEEFVSKSNKSVHFIERSIFTDRNVFLESNFKSGNITEIEYVIYKQWFDWMLEKFKMNADGFVLLNTDYKMCSERIMQRNRTGEETIPLEYLKDLDEYHHMWLSEEQTKNNKPVLSLEASQNFFKDTQSLEEELDKIRNFIEEIKKQNIRFI